MWYSLLANINYFKLSNLDSLVDGTLEQPLSDWLVAMSLGARFKLLIDVEDFSSLWAVPSLHK